MGNREPPVLSAQHMQPHVLTFTAVGRVSEEALVAQLQRGDRAAFGELVHRYQDRVYTLCLRWIGSPTVAEEVAQDVFLALFRALPGFRGESKLSTFVFRIAVNHCKNRRVYARRRHESAHDALEPDPDRAHAPPQLSDGSPDAEAGVFRSEAGRLVQEALGLLDESTRQIILLRDVEDLPYEDIAEILDLPRGTVKSRLHRARAELARTLAQRLSPEDVMG